MEANQIDWTYTLGNHDPQVLMENKNREDFKTNEEYKFHI